MLSRRAIQIGYQQVTIAHAQFLAGRDDIGMIFFDMRCAFHRSYRYFCDPLQYFRRTAVMLRGEMQNHDKRHAVVHRHFFK